MARAGAPEVSGAVNPVSEKAPGGAEIFKPVLDSSIGHPYLGLR